MEMYSSRCLFELCPVPSSSTFHSIVSLNSDDVKGHHGGGTSVLTSKKSDWEDLVVSGLGFSDAF